MNRQAGAAAPNWPAIPARASLRTLRRPKGYFRQWAQRRPGGTPIPFALAAEDNLRVEATSGAARTVDIQSGVVLLAVKGPPLATAAQFTAAMSGSGRLGTSWMVKLAAWAPDVSKVHIVTNCRHIP
ncbi:MAG: hypothetical protein ABI212_02415 [Burkholderiaceae bacterium]